ncbi:uncharacterized protein [Antedon mediterranea]|uniref:uncharacterized protein n=1 Tax=Antedon mediterranea TaxID=105859 RepID=UPI003AF68690
MANTALSKEECSLLKSSVANWFDQRNLISMIKVLYEELVTSKQDLHKSTTTLELINLVNTYKGFSQNDPSLLLATINVTGQHGIWNKIEKLKLPELRQTRTVSMFSEFRQKVMRLGLKMKACDVKRISHLYEETKFRKYEDSWSLIIDLEHNAHLSNKNMTRFIRTLSENSLGHLIYTIDGGEQQVDIVENRDFELPGTAIKKKALVVAVVIAVIAVVVITFITTRPIGGRPNAPTVTLLEQNLTSITLRIEDPEYTGDLDLIFYNISFKYESRGKDVVDFNMFDYKDKNDKDFQIYTIKELLSEKPYKIRVAGKNKYMLGYQSEELYARTLTEGREDKGENQTVYVNTT